MLFDMISAGDYKKINKRYTETLYDYRLIGSFSPLIIGSLSASISVLNELLAHHREDTQILVYLISYPYEANPQDDLNRERILKMYMGRLKVLTNSNKLYTYYMKKNSKKKKVVDDDIYDTGYEDEKTKLLKEREKNSRKFNGSREDYWLEFLN